MQLQRQEAHALQTSPAAIASACFRRRLPTPTVNQDLAIIPRSAGGCTVVATSIRGFVDLLVPVRARAY